MDVHVRLLLSFFIVILDQNYARASNCKGDFQPYVDIRCYVRHIPGQGYILQKCADGDYFDDQTCRFQLTSRYHGKIHHTTDCHNAIYRGRYKHWNNYKYTPKDSHTSSSSPTARTTTQSQGAGHSTSAHKHCFDTYSSYRNLYKKRDSRNCDSALSVWTDLYNLRQSREGCQKLIVDELMNNGSSSCTCSRKHVENRYTGTTSDHFQNCLSHKTYRDLIRLLVTHTSANAYFTPSTTVQCHSHNSLWPLLHGLKQSSETCFIDLIDHLRATYQVYGDKCSHMCHTASSSHASTTKSTFQTKSQTNSITTPQLAHTISTSPVTTIPTPSPQTTQGSTTIQTTSTMTTIPTSTPQTTQGNTTTQTTSAMTSQGNTSIFTTSQKLSTHVSTLTATSMASTTNVLMNVTTTGTSTAQILNTTTDSQTTIQIAANYMNCSKLKTIEELAKFQELYPSLSKNCSMSVSSLVIKDLCNGVPDHNVWKPGQKVLDICDSLPSFTAVATFTGSTFPVDGLAGVFVDCTQTYLKIATEECGGQFEIVTIPRQPSHTNTFNHIASSFYTISV